MGNAAGEALMPGVSVRAVALTPPTGSGIFPLADGGRIPLAVDSFHPARPLFDGLTCTFDITATAPVSTTVGLGIAPRLDLGRISQPVLEQLVLVLGVDPSAIRQSVEVIRVDAEQDERVGGQVPVSLDDG